MPEDNLRKSPLLLQKKCTVPTNRNRVTNKVRQYKFSLTISTLLSIAKKTKLYPCGIGT